MAVHMPKLTRATSSSDVTVLVAILGLAAAVELAILRTFTRTAIHIPALEQMQDPYEALAGAGRYAYFVAIGLVFPVLGVLSVRIARGNGPARWLALFAMAGFGVAAAGATAGVVPESGLGAATIWAVAMLGLALAAGSGRLSVRTAPAASFAVAFGLSGAYTLMPSVGASAQPSWLLDGAEVAGLAFALTLPVIVTGNDRRSMLIAAGVAVFALVVFLGNGSTSRFLLLWNIGLSGTLPGVAYAAAAGALAFTGARLLRTGSALGACGVLLLVAGGIGLHSSYQSALVVAGLAALYVALVEAKTQQSR
jgi:hypothetical protein